MVNGKWSMGKANGKSAAMASKAGKPALPIDHLLLTIYCSNNKKAPPKRGFFRNAGRNQPWTTST
jgi:hypothetical protein